ncbi:MAG TPA: serine/threonine-protein kinase [Verrucomicrobiae bacterium]|nr:serine/threonine-protein kinase [Verrucomicrobiae bacterium]
MPGKPTAQMPEEFDIKALFHDVADLPAGARERYFDRHHVPSEVRAEVLSLCEFDSRQQSLTGCIAEMAADLINGSEATPGPGTLCGPYKLVRLLGKGGMGSVFLAERADGEVENTVAVKFIRGAFDDALRRGRFLRERQILASLKHPNVAGLIDAGHTAAGQPYLVMEYIQGLPLDEFARTLDVRGKLRLFLQVCAALAYAHRNLVIHRDLKPSNVLVDANGQAKLLDFGIARILDEEQARGATQERLLTPDFASPEQVLGQAQTTATDVYSLGAMLYWVLTGKSPHAWTDGNVHPVETIICSIDPPAPSRVDRALPQDLDFIVLKALRKKPEERYASVEALAGDIEAFLEHRPIRARSGSTWYHTRKLLRRHWLPASAIASAMFCLAAGAYVANRERVVAQNRFSQLRELSVTLLNLDTDLNGLSGATAVRQKVVSASMQYLEGLSREAGRDKNLSLDLAKGYLSLAQVQGVPTVPNLGQFDEADKSLRKAEEFAERAGAEKGNLRALMVAAEADQDRMIVADTVRRVDDTIALAQKCAARIELWMRDKSATKEDLHQGVRLLDNVAQAEMNMHRYDEAVRYSRRAVELARSTGSPRDYLIGGLSVLANASRLTGDLLLALQSVSESIAIARTTQFGSEVQTSSVLYSALNRQGMILGDYESISLNRPADAIAAFQEAYELVDGQAAHDPNDANSRIRVATVGREIGDLLASTDPRRSLAIFDHSLERLREAKASVLNSRTQADVLARSSYPLRRLGRIAEAGARVDSAFALLRATKDYPASEVTLGMEADTALRALADQEAAAGQPARALETYRDLLSKALASKPTPETDLQQANHLSRIFLGMARLARVTRQTQEADALDVRRREVWRLWDRKLPGNVYVKRQLAESSAP